MVDTLALERLATRYSFLDLDEYKDLLCRDVGEGMRIYWVDMLERAHIAAVTAILRSRRWLAAVLSTRSEKNALAFAAAFRGLMESAADAATALIVTPLTLARDYPDIAKAISGEATAVVISSELEDELIHYSHARYVKNSERASAPKSHKARTTQKYRKVFEPLNANSVSECYRFLCDLTHPAGPSVWMWLEPVDAKGSEFVLSPKQDEAIVARVLNLYKTVLLDVLMLAFNTPVILLNTLNYFPIKKLHTRELLKHDLDSLAAWRKCRNALEQGGARLQTSVL